MISVEFKKLNESAIPFKYSYEDDACMDIYCNTETFIPKMQTYIVKTGIAIKLPIGYEGRVIGRSGLASRGILVHHGVIDPGYTGEIGVIITNLSDRVFIANVGDRIAQFSIHRIYRMNFKETENLIDSYSKRGTNGYGSTGI
jgi:dUTP pyrophosphatase